MKKVIVVLSVMTIMLLGIVILDNKILNEENQLISGLQTKVNALNGNVKTLQQSIITATMYGWYNGCMYEVDRLKQVPNDKYSETNGISNIKGVFLISP